MPVLRQSAPVSERIPEAYPEAHGGEALCLPALFVRHNPKISLKNSREEATSRSRSVILYLDYASATVVKDKWLCVYLMAEY